MAKKRIRFSSRKNIKKSIKKKEDLGRTASATTISSSEPQLCFPDNETTEICFPDIEIMEDEVDLFNSGGPPTESRLPDGIVPQFQGPISGEEEPCPYDATGNRLSVGEPALSDKPLQEDVPSTFKNLEPSPLETQKSTPVEPSRVLDLTKPNDLAPVERDVGGSPMAEKEKKTVRVIMLAPGAFMAPSQQFEEVKVIRIVEMDDRSANFSILIDVEQLDFQFTNIINLQTNMPLSLLCPLENNQELPFFNENILKSPFLSNSPKSKNKYIMRKPITSDMFIAWSDKRDPYKTYKISMIMKNNSLNSNMNNTMNYACIQLFNTMVFDFNISPFFFCTK